MGLFDLNTSAPTLGANNMQGNIPWEQILAGRRQITPEEVLGQALQYALALRGGARRDMGGFIQKPTQSQQLAEENAVWEAKFPANRQAQAVEKEQAAFGNRLPSFTQQEMARRGQTPQERINVSMGPGWETLTPQQRRVILQKRVGQRPDYQNPVA